MFFGLSPRAWWSRLGLRGRLAVTMALILLGFAVLSQGLEIHRAAAEFRKDIAREVDTGLDGMSATVALYAAAGDVDGIRMHLREQARRPYLRELAWVSANGNTRLVASGAHRQVEAPGWFRAFVDLPLTRQTRPVALHGNRYGMIEASFDPGPWETRLWRQARAGLGHAALTLLALFAAISFLLHANLRVLNRLPALATRFAGGDYRVREAVDSRLAPEVRELLASLNRVADDMQATLRTMAHQQKIQGEQLHFQRELLDAIPIPVYYKGRDGVYLGANRAWEVFFGRPAASMIGHQVFELYPDNPELAAQHDAKDQALWAQPGVQSYEIDVAAASGPRRTIYTKAVYRDAGGEVAGIVGTISDVTHLRQVEAENFRIRQAVEGASDAIMICDPGGRAVFVNRAFTALTGRGLDQLQGEEEMPGALGDARAQAEICPRVKGGESWEGELQVVGRSGQPVPVFMRASPIQGPNGEVIGLMSVMTDMSELQRAEAVTQRFGRVLDQSLNEIYTFDAETLKFTQVNLGARRNLGYSLSEMLAMTPLDIKPHYTPQTFEALVAPLREGRADRLRFETVHRRRDGTEYPVEISLQLFRAETPQLFVAVVEDVSERRRAEETLRRNEEKYRALVEATNDWLWEIDANGTYTYASPRVRDILGYAPEEVVGRRPSFFMPPEEAARVSALFAELAAERKPLTLLENVNLHKDGRRVVLETSALPIFDDAGNWRGYRGIDRDVTPRKAAEEAYWESEARFENMTGNVPGMVFQCTLQAQGELGFRYVSEGAWALCGERPQALLDDAQNFLKRIVDTDRDRFLECLAESLRGLSAWNWEGRLDVADGAKWINWRASPRLLDGGAVVWDGVAVNVTEAKTAQADLIQSQRQLQALSAYLQTAREEEKAHISREIHDELGGTLTALKMDAYWLAKKLPSGFEDLQGKLKGILGMVDGAVQTTRRICTELRPTVLDDLGLVAAIEWQVAEFQKRMDIECVFQRPASDVELDEGMAVALFRILQESLTNVARHANASRVYVAYQATADTVCLAVEDNGCGIAPRAMEAGHSHGLRGIRERVRQFNGRVDITGTPGRGTGVLVQLKLERAAKEGQGA